MASKGRGRGLRPQNAALLPGSRSPPGRSDPIGEAALAVQLPERPNIGKAGREIRLITNHFEMKVARNNSLYHYDISIEQGTGRDKTVWTNGKARGLSRLEIRDICYKIYEQWVKECRLNFFEIIYDRQKNLYCLNDLGDLGYESSTPIKYKGQMFTVIITMCNPLMIDISPQTISNSIMDTVTSTVDRSPLQILDLITNQFLFYLYAKDRTEFIHFGRHFFRPRFDRNQRPHELAMGRVIYEGFFKSLRLVMGPKMSADSMFLTVNIDTKKAPFFKAQPLVDTVMQTLNLRGEPRYPLDNDQIRTLNRHLQNIRVHTVYDRKTVFLLCSFTSTPCEQQKFNWNGRHTSIADYHATRYGAKIRFPMLPCARKRGKPGEYCYFPIEVLSVVEHQKVELRKTNEEQSRELIKISAVPPEQRLAEIQYMARFTDESPAGDENHFVTAFGVQRSKELMRVSGRVLPAPRIMYNERERNNVSDVRNGQWNLQNQMLYIPSTIEKYAVVAFANPANIRNEQIQRFISCLAACAQNLGVQLPRHFSGDYAKDDDADPLLRYLGLNGFRFVICIMGDHVKTDKLRNAIKLCEVKYTLVTQCVRTRTIQKCLNNPSPNNETFKNLIYKINAKNGGVNNELQLNDPIPKKWIRPGVMFVGMDVNHPPPMSKAELAQGILPKEPSVVGIVANTGRSISDYRMQYFLQDMRKEEISEHIMVDAFCKFIEDYASNHKGERPDTVIVYRDGVSEGQYKMVVDREILAMKQAFASLKPRYDPKLTVLTVQKRHNTRFFHEHLIDMAPEESRRMKNTEKNIPAGTVVDTGPVSAKLFDFFLCSHSGLQGTSKPSYYVVMTNECQITADELQMVTFMLCHDYQRCTKSVSIPAPCYHAHHAATRGKSNYLAATIMGDDSSSGISSGSSADDSSMGGMKKDMNYDMIQKQIEYGPLMVDKMIWL